MLLSGTTLMGLVMAACTAGAASAETLLSTWLGPTRPITIHAHEEWSGAVRSATDGEVDIRLDLGGALIPARASTQGIADGVAQIGFVSTAYTPSELPVSNALGDMGFATPDPMLLRRLKSVLCGPCSGTAPCRCRPRRGVNAIPRKSLRSWPRAVAEAPRNRLTTGFLPPRKDRVSPDGFPAARQALRQTAHLSRLQADMPVPCDR